MNLWMGCGYLVGGVEALGENLWTDDDVGHIPADKRTTGVGVSCG